MVKAQFIIFALGFLFPFILQLFWVRSAGGVIFLNLICAITQFLLVLIELLQIKGSSCKVYLNNIWNIVDLILVALFTVYFLMRFSDPT